MASTVYPRMHRLLNERISHENGCAHHFISRDHLPSRQTGNLNYLQCPNGEKYLRSAGDVRPVVFFCSLDVTVDVMVPPGT